MARRQLEGASWEQLTPSACQLAPTSTYFHSLYQTRIGRIVPTFGHPAEPGVVSRETESKELRADCRDELPLSPLS